MTANDMPMSSSDATTTKSAIDTLNSNVANINNTLRFFEQTFLGLGDTTGEVTLNIPANAKFTEYAIGYVPAWRNNHIMEGWIDAKCVMLPIAVLRTSGNVYAQIKPADDSWAIHFNSGATKMYIDRMPENTFVAVFGIS
jgi:hypothetical protein